MTPPTRRYQTTYQGSRIMLTVLILLVLYAGGMFLLARGPLEYSRPAQQTLTLVCLVVWTATAVACRLGWI